MQEQKAKTQLSAIEYGNAMSTLTMNAITLNQRILVMPYDIPRL